MFVILDSNGVPQTLSDKDQGGMVMVPEGIDPARSMLTGGSWVLRPAVALPVLTGNTLTIATYPVGTTVEVVDMEDRVILFAGVFDGGLTFQNAGSYQIEVKPPSPWVGWSGRIVRS